MSAQLSLSGVKRTSVLKLPLRVTNRESGSRRFSQGPAAPLARGHAPHSNEVEHATCLSSFERGKFHRRLAASSKAFRRLGGCLPRCAPKSIGGCTHLEDSPDDDGLIIPKYGLMFLLKQTVSGKRLDFRAIAGEPNGPRGGCFVRQVLRRRWGLHRNIAARHSLGSRQSWASAVGIPRTAECDARFAASE
jgi:hypothetical protein